MAQPRANRITSYNVCYTKLLRKAIDIKFDGQLEEYWDNQYHCVNLVNYTTVKAIPYDMYVSGYDSEGVSVLRLWRAQAPSFDMELFNKGDYSQALGRNNFV